MKEDKRPQIIDLAISGVDSHEKARIVMDTVGDKSTEPFTQEDIDFCYGFGDHLLFDDKRDECVNFMFFWDIKELAIDKKVITYQSFLENFAHDKDRV